VQAARLHLRRICVAFGDASQASRLSYGLCTFGVSVFISEDFDAVFEFEGPML
jgi:hypothetical protein